MWKLFLIAVGFFAASFTSGSGSVYARTPDGYDQEQHQVVGKIPGMKDGHVVAIIFLLRGRFNCPEGQARAVLVHSAGGVWVGCYRKIDSNTHVVFEDGEELTVRSVDRST